MTVYFIGAGPGAADLITVRGARLLGSCPVCLYAGSIMPDDLLALCPADAKVVDTGPLNLDQIIDELVAAEKAGVDVAGYIPVIHRSTVRWPNSAAASMNWASDTRSCRAYRLSRPWRPRWSVSSRSPGSPRPLP